MKREPVRAWRASKQWGRVMSPVRRAVLFGFVLALAVFFMGPRNDFGPDAPAPRDPPPAELARLDAWLSQAEAVYTDIRPGLAKGVVWHEAPGQRTPWAVVYLHGFTASRLETAPMAEQFAQRLGANLFHTRLAGHGRSSAAMGEPTVQDWLADTAEALRIGQLLGERVVVIGVSTGATLATWAATRPEGQAVTGYVLVSPNYGPKNKQSELINGPWGRQLALALEGDERGSVSPDAREAQAWTERYPTQALFPMMALVKQVRESDLSTFKAPVMVLYSEGDQTVDPEEIKALFPRIGAERKTLVAVDYSEAVGQHVLAGDIRAPKATPVMVDAMAQWAQALP
jgi:alpha-beta hydrolase superfamily lysophospholipase